MSRWEVLGQYTVWGEIQVAIGVLGRFPLLTKATRFRKSKSHHIKTSSRCDIVASKTSMSSIIYTYCVEGGISALNIKAFSVAGVLWSA